MEFRKVSTIITEQVLNQHSGELEPKQFQEVAKAKRIRGGFSMVYKSYDDVLSNCIKSNLDWQIILHIRQQFTYARIEVVLSPTTIAAELQTSKQNITKLIKQLVENGFLKRVAKSTYRLNPFMYVPFRGNTEELQREWSSL